MQIKYIPRGLVNTHKSRKVRLFQICPLNISRIVRLFPAAPHDASLKFQICPLDVSRIVRLLHTVPHDTGLKFQICSLDVSLIV